MYLNQIPDFLGLVFNKNSRFFCENQNKKNATWSMLSKGADYYYYLHFWVHDKKVSKVLKKSCSINTILDSFDVWYCFRSEIESHAASCQGDSSGGKSVSCPICSQRFPSSIIETHAAECGIAWTWMPLQPYPIYNIILVTYARLCNYINIFFIMKHFKTVKTYQEPEFHIKMLITIFCF